MRRAELPRGPRAHGARDPRRLRRLARAAALREPARLLGLRLPRGLRGAPGSPRALRPRPTGPCSRRSRPTAPPAAREGDRARRPTSTRSPTRRSRWVPSSRCCAPRARVPLYLAAYAEGPADPALTASLVATRDGRARRVLRRAPRSPHYTALVELLKPVSPDHRYGFSMEHLDSSHYFLAADGGVTALTPEPQRRRVLFNFAHHLAHSWIPKRAYGEGYFPFSWELAPVIDTIWLSEGFARYAAIEALADAMPGGGRRGVPEGAARLASLDARRDAAVHPRHAARRSCRGSPRRATRRTSGPGETLFARGALLADALDARIRSESGGRKRFRDFLRHLVAWSARERRGFRRRGAARADARRDRRRGARRLGARAALAPQSSAITMMRSHSAKVTLFDFFGLTFTP